MSQLKLILAKGNNVSVMKVIDKEYDSTMECWAYHDCVLFEVNGHMITMSHKQLVRICDFAKTEAIKNNPAAELGGKS